MKINIDATDYRKIQLNGDVQLTTQTSHLTLEMDRKRFQVTGSLIGRRLVVQIKTPLAGLEVTDMSARWNERQQVDLGLTSPSLGNIFFSRKYDVGQSLQFGRLVITPPSLRNELMVKLTEPWMKGEILKGCPAL